MSSINQFKASKTSTRFFSESSKIWLNAMGLSISVLLLVGLLTVIAKNGLKLFQVKDIASLQLKDGNLVIGEVVKKQKIDSLENFGPKVIVIDSDSKDNHLPPTLSQKSASKVAYEYQIYIANRNFYGKSFIYIPVDHVLSIRYPKENAKIIRLGHGPIIGEIVGLQVDEVLTEKEKLSKKTFTKTLHALLKENNKQRRKIKYIEKNQIGKINDKINKEELKLKIAQKKLALENLSDKKKILLQKKITMSQAKIERLENLYQTLANKSHIIRKTLEKHQLQVKIVDPAMPTLLSVVKISMAEVLSYTTPNAYNFFTKGKHYVVNVVEFLTTDPREANTEGGIFPAIFGTFVMTVLMSILVVPAGVIVAIYLKEYAKKGWLLNFIRISINNLAGVPSIVFGVFGVGFFIYFLGGSIDQIFFKEKLPTPTFGTGGILWASLTLALLTIPVVIVATEEALTAIPMSSREGALACGATKWQTIWNIILPSASPGILTGFILAMARGAGEVAPLMIVGAVKLAPSLAVDLSFPFIHLERKFMHLGFHIYDLGFQSPDSEAALPMVFASTLTLLLLILLLNISAIFIRNALRNKLAKNISAL